MFSSLAKTCRSAASRRAASSASTFRKISIWSRRDWQFRFTRPRSKFVPHGLFPTLPACGGAGGLLSRDAVRGDAPRLHHHLDGVVDAVLGVADRGRQIVERESVGVDLGGVETLLRHEGFGAMRRALALAADAVEINVVALDVGDVDRRLVVRERGETDLAAAIDHADRF